MIFVIFLVTLLIAVFTVVAFLNIFSSYRGSQKIISFLGFIIGCLFFYLFVTNDTVDKIVQKDSEIMQAEQIERSKPHLFSKNGECEVYEFWGNDGNRHYFTKCPNSETTTTNPIREGKYTREEQITTH